MNNKLYELKWAKEQLWQGCILASIAHAIMVAHYPELSNEQSWDGINYNVQNNTGARGTVTFGSQYCIAAFRDDHSDRIVTKNKIQEANTYFKNAPKEIMNFAEIETLQYLLDNVDGKTVPLITTAFWEMEDKLFSVDSFDDMINNGGFLLKSQVMGFEMAVREWKEYYDMSVQQCTLLESIYTRKVSRPNSNLVLSREEVALIGTDDPGTLDESKTSFGELNIQWED
ncbi:hypothetical protein [Anaerosinus massiliensis]|uniref:hypothetical protein n=1 Tax=Massilibacillus massiliensis TaxID=1806837 RepID=UPI000AC50812|nr:hypothetical protein [Massilibacillus massiliensis]